MPLRQWQEVQEVLRGLSMANLLACAGFKQAQFQAGTMGVEGLCPDQSDNPEFLLSDYEMPLL